MTYCDRCFQAAYQKVKWKVGTHPKHPEHADVLCKGCSEALIEWLLSLLPATMSYSVGPIDGK